MLEDNKYAGNSYIDVFIDLKKTFNVVLVGLSRKVDGTWKLFTNPPEGEQILANDYLVIMGSGRAKKKIVEVFGVEEGRIIQ